MSNSNDATEDVDDLDAFFDEVEEQVVAAVVVRQESTDGDDNTSNVKCDNAKSTTADNALVGTDDLHPPMKKAKINHGPPVLPPRGIVVASASAAAASTTTTSNNNNNITTTSNTNTSTTNNNRNNIYDSTTTTTTNSSYSSYPTIPLMNGTLMGSYIPPVSSSLLLHPHRHSIGTTTTTTGTAAVAATTTTTTPSIVVMDHPGMTTTTTSSSTSTTNINHKNNQKLHIRTVAGKVWVDPSLSDWPDNDYRIFVGNLDPTVTDQQLYQHFATHYPSLNQVRIIRDKKKNNTSLGYGFVSLFDPLECARAIREQDQTWLGGRPIRIKRSHWKDRELQEKQQQQQQQPLQQKLHKKKNNNNNKKRH